MEGSFPVQDIRNVGIIAHIDAGKTTLTERILFETKTIRRMGEVPDGTTVTDFLPEEREHGISIAAAAVTCHWKQWQINVVDTPGHIDFTAEVERSLAVMDGVVVVLDATKGVQAQTETVWRQASRHHLPAVVFVNKMDRPGAAPEHSVQEITERLGIPALPVQYPRMADGVFLGSVDLLEEKLPEKMLSPEQQLEAEVLRERLVEALAECDDGILSDFLANRVPGREAMLRGMRRGTLQRKFVPVLFGSSLLNCGVREVLDAVGAFLPSPEDGQGFLGDDGPLSMRIFRVEESVRTGGRLAYARVFSGTAFAGLPVRNHRTGQTAEIGEILRIHASETRPLSAAHAGEIVALAGDWGGRIRTGDVLASPDAPLPGGAMSFPQPVCSVLLHAEKSSQNALLAAVLKELVREDPTLRLRPSGSSGWLLSGMGELHLEIVRERLRAEYGVATHAGQPKVEYRCAAFSASEGTECFEKRFPDGRCIRAEVSLSVEPRAPGVGFLLEGAAAVKGLPEECRQAVMQGIRYVVHAEGFGFPLTDTKVTLLRVSLPNRETTETAYFEAARLALERVLSRADVRELEPIMKLEIRSPQDGMGGIVADLRSRRGEILQVDSIGSEYARLVAYVPLAELFGYASSLRSLSAGRGEVVAEPAKYAVRASHC